MRLVIVSGLSGTGKTVALKLYEDLGYYCIDNIPLDLVQPLIAHAVSHPEPRYSEFAIGVDARELPSIHPGLDRAAFRLRPCLTGLALRRLCLRKLPPLAFLWT